MSGDRRFSITSDLTDYKSELSYFEDETQSTSQQEGDAFSESPRTPTSDRSTFYIEQAPELPPKDYDSSSDSPVSTVAGMPLAPPAVHMQSRDPNTSQDHGTTSFESGPDLEQQPSSRRSTVVKFEDDKPRRVCGLPPWALALLACFIAILVFTVILVPSIFLGRLATKGHGQSQQLSNDFGNGMTPSHGDRKLAVRTFDQRQSEKAGRRTQRTYPAVVSVLK